MSDCSFKKDIEYNKELNTFLLKVICSNHDILWVGSYPAKDFVLKAQKDFPLVTGGLIFSSKKGDYLTPLKIKDCMLPKIPRHNKR